MGFVKTPNLPKNRVKKVISGKLLKPYENKLKELGIDVLYTNDSDCFTSSLKSHGDLFVNYLGEGIIVIDKSQKSIENALLNYDFKLIHNETAITGKYPDDCRLNCVLTDDIIICNEAHTDRKLLEFAYNKGLRIINVRQGYCKCSVLTVTDKAFITDDSGIEKALRSSGFDCLCVEKGSIALNGFDYGFIGGCSGKISNNEIAFCGDIKKHKNADSIIGFLNNYNIDAVCLSDGQLTDVGSIIPIIEK